ncbi:MAG: sel1 repeat family protein [Myxococcaceae bacterium]|nr:sel1 repeat family protein [Myxococcaceae bacterium]
MRLLVVTVLVLSSCTCRTPAASAAEDAGARACATHSACLAECEQGRGEACANAARGAFAGVGTRRSLEVGWLLEWRGCRAGHLPSCARVGLANPAALPMDGGVDQQVALSRAASGLGARCREADAESCELAFRLGLEDGGTAGRALSILSSSCDAGTAGACSRLGEHLLDGELGVRDVGAGAASLQRACDLGVAGACASLGLRLLEGRALEADRPRAQALLSRAGQLSADAGW